MCRDCGPSKKDPGTTREEPALLLVKPEWKDYDHVSDMVDHAKELKAIENEMQYNTSGRVSPLEKEPPAPIAPDTKEIASDAKTGAFHGPRHAGTGGSRFAEHLDEKGFDSKGLRAPEMKREKQWLCFECVMM